MQPSFDDYHHTKKLWYQLTLSQDINDQRMLQFDWTRGTTGHLQPKEVVKDANFSWWVIPCKKVRYQLILSQDIVDQRILQSDWTWDTTGHTQPKSVVSHHALPRWLIL